MKLLRLYLEEGSTSPLDFIHMRISPWYQFSVENPLLGVGWAEGGQVPVVAGR